jgi:hypothetical protein
MSDDKKLTPKQTEVMKWLVGGWQPTNLCGAVVEVNGKYLCNVSTMKVLEQRGFAEKVTRYQWRITVKGAEFVKG